MPPASPITLLALLSSSLLTAGQIHDVVVYGGTSAGVMAAVQAKRMGKSVVIVCPDKHLGGLSSGGLGWTDTGKKEIIGGLAREFYHRVWKHYQTDEAWKWQKRSQYGNKGQGSPAIDGTQRTMWIFEPHVAELVFEDYPVPGENRLGDEGEGFSQAMQMLSASRIAIAAQCVGIAQAEPERSLVCFCLKWRSPF